MDQNTLKKDQKPSKMTKSINFFNRLIDKRKMGQNLSYFIQNRTNLINFFKSKSSQFNQKLIETHQKLKYL